MVGMRDYPEH